MSAAARPDDVQAIRDVVELVGEQVPVQVERHARRGVPKHLLNYLDVAAGRDRQRGSRMT